MRKLPRFLFAVGASLWFGCSSSDGGASGMHFHGETEVLPGFSGDTGLQPSGSSVQVEFVVIASGTVTADADADSGGPASAPVVVGRAASGKLVVDGHFKLAGKLKIDISGLPKYDGPIPDLDGVDLQFGGESAFDPFLLGGAGAKVVGDIPETKLPDIPLPGGLTGKLVLTIVKGSTVTSELRGVCAGIADGSMQYLAKTTTNGKLLIKPTVVVKIPIKGDKSFDLPEIPVPIPSKSVPMDLGTQPVSDGDTPAAGDVAATATQGSCSGSSTDGGTEGGGTDSSTTDSADDHGTVSSDGALESGGVPGEVTCGSKSCSIPSHYCCIAADGSNESCLTSSFGCGGNEVRCDQTADCESGVCCAVPDAVTFTVSVACQASCTGGYVRQACASDSECSGATCITEVCRGRIISTCGGLPPEIKSACG